MRATVFLSAAITGALALVSAHPAAAQAQPQPSAASSAAPVHVTIPQEGLTFNFGDIDRNGDGNISIEEWNAFVASLQSRLAAKETGSAAAGATAAPKPPQPQQR